MKLLPVGIDAGLESLLSNSSDGKDGFGLIGLLEFSEILRLFLENLFNY